MVYNGKPMMKEYNKLMKEVEKDPDFELTKTGRKTTVKLVHISSGELYSIHPGDNAVRPLKNWMKRKKEGR